MIKVNPEGSVYTCNLDKIILSRFPRRNCTKNSMQAGFCVSTCTENHTFTGRSHLKYLVMFSKGKKNGDGEDRQASTWDCVKVYLSWNTRHHQNAVGRSNKFLLWSIQLALAHRLILYTHSSKATEIWSKFFSLPHACVIKGQHAPILCTLTLHSHTQFPSHFNSRSFFKNKTNNSQIC